jgi:hypothetical protein
MSRTASNLVTELWQYLTDLGYEVYIGSRNKAVELDPNTLLFTPYIVITNTPANLLTRDMRAAGNREASRTMSVTLHVIGNARTDGVDDAGELLEEVNDLLELNWHATDSDCLWPYASYSVDNSNTNTEIPRAIRTQLYMVHKNLRD